jgi:Uma2 family endonuclease
MATASLIPVSEYLRTTYRPDCDYIDGEIQERNVGERPHSFLQSILVAIFNANRLDWNIVAGTEIRVQITPTRFRIPDVAVLRRSDPADPIVQRPPLIAIEILSPEDRLYRLQQRIDDYTHMGVENIWLIDPLSRHAWLATPDGSHTRVHQAFTVPNTPIHIDLAALFAELDDMLTPTPA